MDGIHVFSTHHLLYKENEILTIRSIGRKLSKLFTTKSLCRLGKVMMSLPRSMVKLIAMELRARASGRRLHLVILMESMGDVIAGEPVFRELADPGYTVVWVLSRPYGDLVRFNPHVGEILELSCVSEWLALDAVSPWIAKTRLLMDGVTCAWFGLPFKNPNPFGIRVGEHYRHGSLLDCYALMGIGRRLDTRPHAYGDPTFDASKWVEDHFPEGRDGFVAFHCSAREPERIWPADRFQDVADWIIANTPLAILEFGLEPVLNPGPRVHHLGGKLPLHKQARVLARARLLVGVDSGFSHMANACAIRAVVVLGRYKGLTEHMPYSGPWRQGIGCSLVRTPDSLQSLPAFRVLEAVRFHLEQIPSVSETDHIEIG